MKAVTTIRVTATRVIRETIQTNKDKYHISLNLIALMYAAIEGHLFTES